MIPQLNPNVLMSLDTKKKKLCQIFPDLAPYFLSIQYGSSFVSFLHIHAFKEFEIFLKEKEEKRFYSSGTTGEKRGCHLFSKEGLNRYQTNTVAGFRRFLESTPIAPSTLIYNLVPSSWSTSSLNAMLQMFSSSGLPLIESLPVEQKPLLALEQLRAKAEKNNEIIVFGTTLHHLLLCQAIQEERQANPIPAKNKNSFFKKLFLFDTGGTKSQTEYLDPIKLKQDFLETYSALSEQVTLFSEYGMCELSSQAWSLAPPLFKTNETLLPFGIDIYERKITPEGKEAFLGFFDFGNEDSYEAILTEDIGVIKSYDEGLFSLKGRAYDASAKGCSLHVKGGTYLFQPWLKKENTITVAPSINSLQAPLSTKISLSQFFSQLTSSLAEEPWASSFLSDLTKSFPDKDLFIQKGKEKQSQTLFIIMSANTPIAWLFPALSAYELGYRKLVLKLPSLRGTDSYVSLVREQIKKMVEALCFENDFEIVISESLAGLEKELSPSDTMIVFGSDETIRFFKERFIHERVLGFGEIINAYHVPQESLAQEIAPFLSTWWGRGCLTPRVLFLQNKNIEDWSHSLFKELNSIFKQRGETLLSASLLRSQIEFERLGGKKSCLSKECGIFILPSETSNLKEEPFLSNFLKSLGQGGVLITNKKPSDFNMLSFFHSFPTLRDPHMGKTWQEWLS